MCNFKVTACCGCIPLRIGCIALAAVMLVLGITLALVMPESYGATWLKVLIIILAVITWVTLLIGAIISHATVVIVSLIGLLLLIIKDAAMMIIIIIAFSSVAGTVGVTGGEVTWFVILMIGYVIGLGLSIYFGIVINSLYQELKFGGQGPSYNV